MLSWFVDIFDAPTVEDMVFLTINQRSGKDSPRFMGINSSRERVKSRPFAALQDRPSERDGSARERGLRIKAWRCTRGGYSATTARLPLKA
jgi:hypothetical protein